MLWIPVTVAAAAFQIARNAAQRGLMGGAGPWGATLVRFLFGLPFAFLFAVAAWIGARGDIHIHATPAFWTYAVTGSVSQVVATAALLVSMRRAGFAVGTAVQQSTLPLSGILGWVVFGDALSQEAILGVAIATVGLAILTWPRKAPDPQIEAADKPVSGALYGLLSGLLFGFSFNAYRHAAVTMEPSHPLFSATATVTVTQFMQSVALTAILAVRKPSALEAVIRGWRGSLFAGFCGATASACWLFALAMAPAAPVRAVGVVEAPMAAAAGRRLFKERLSWLKLFAIAVVAVGVVLTALGGTSD
jgi:drug/metabolite transporter (DMT)-like permease